MTATIVVLESRPDWRLCTNNTTRSAKIAASLLLSVDDYFSIKISSLNRRRRRPVGARCFALKFDCRFFVVIARSPAVAAVAFGDSQAPPPHVRRALNRSLMRRAAESVGVRFGRDDASCRRRFRGAI